jgi:hypothetical protein
MEYLMSVIVALIALVINIIAISHTAYKNEKLTCDNYIINSYLYFTLAVLIVVFTVVVNVKFQILEKIAPMLVSFVGTIIFLIAIFALFYYFKSLDPTKNKVEIHAVWTFIFVVLSIVLYPAILFTKLTNILPQVLGVVLLIIVLTAYLGINHGDWVVRFDWDKYLYGALVVLLILILLLVMTGNYTENIDIFLTYAILIIFILLMISYNKRLVENSKKCLENNNPNYLDESLGLFTKIMNVFVRVARLMGRRR